MSPEEPSADPTSEDPRLRAFRPIHLRRASEEVVEVLIDAIRSGIYQPGDLLPPERDLAARLEISRVPVREAIKVLRDQGIVSTRRGKHGGTVVESLANVPRILAQLHDDPMSNMRSLLELRRLLELPCTLLAARTASDDDLDQLEDLVDQLGRSLHQSHAEIVEVDVRFHIAVAQLTRNRPLAEALRTVLNQIVVVRSLFPFGFVEIGQSYENQQTLMRALRSRDPAVIRPVLDDHLSSLEEVVLGFRLEFIDGLDGETSTATTTATEDGSTRR